MRSKPPFCLVMIVFLLPLLCLSLPVTAAPRATIAQRDMRILLHSDGSADVSDQIVFAIHGSVNNLVMEIRKPAQGGVQLDHVISSGYRGVVILRPLESGQWDPTVFAGTYSLFDEPDRLRIKAYYTYGTYRSRFLLQYRMPQAATRTSQVSRLVLMPVSADWPTGVGRIRVQIHLPEAVAPEDVDVLLHGVLIGKTEVLDDRTLRVDIPDTVPGEMPVLEVLVPSEALPDAPLSEGNLSREEYRVAHRQAWEAALEPSLHARERAAALAGQEAMRMILLHRLRRMVGIGALAVSLAALLYWVRLLRKNGRRTALRAGTMLFCAGLVLGVGLAIWQPYVMLAPACLLVARGAPESLISCSDGTHASQKSAGIREFLQNNSQ